MGHVLTRFNAEGKLGPKSFQMAAKVVMVVVMV